MAAWQQPARRRRRDDGRRPAVARHDSALGAVVARPAPVALSPEIQTELGLNLEPAAAAPSSETKGKAGAKSGGGTFSNIFLEQAEAAPSSETKGKSGANYSGGGTFTGAVDVQPAPKQGAKKPIITMPKHEWALGDVVALTRVEGLDAVEGTTGVVFGSEGALFDVRLKGGETVKCISTGNLAKPALALLPGTEKVYAPVSTSQCKNSQHS